MILGDSLLVMTSSTSGGFQRAPRTFRLSGGLSANVCRQTSPDHACGVRSASLSARIRSGSGRPMVLDECPALDLIDQRQHFVNAAFLDELCGCCPSEQTMAREEPEPSIVRGIELSEL